MNDEKFVLRVLGRGCTGWLGLPLENFLRNSLSKIFFQQDQPRIDIFQTQAYDLYY